MTISSCISKLFLVFTAFVLCLVITLPVFLVPRSAIAQEADYSLIGGDGSGGSTSETMLFDTVTGDVLLRGGGGIGDTGNGDDGGDVSASRAGDLSVGGKMSVIGGDGGEGGIGNGGQGGDARFVATGAVIIDNTLSVTSGGAGTGVNGGSGGGAYFTAETLTAPTINLTKYNGEFSFSATNLEIGSNSDTTLTAIGLASGDANINNLRLTGDKNFILNINGASNISIEQLVIDGGTLNDENWNNLVGGGISYITSNIILDVDGAMFYISDNQSLGRALTGTGGLTKEGVGTLTLTGANNYAGNTTVNAGTLSIGSDSNIGTGLNTLAGGTLRLTGEIYSKAWTLDEGSNVIENGIGVTFGGNLTGAGGFTKTGTGILTLTGANTYTGDTTVNAGTLAGSIATNTNLTVAAGATYDGTGAARSVDALNGNGSVINTNSLTVQSGAFGGVISGSGFLTKTGAGTLTLTGTNTYGGGTTINQGLINFNSIGNFGSGNITLNGGGLQWANNYIGADISARLNPLGVSGGIFDTNGNSIILDSVISGSGSLTKAGEGTLTLTRTNTYTGGTTISQGLINFNSVDNFGSGQITLNGGGLQWATGFSVDISARLNPLGSSGGIFDTNGNSITLSSVLSGSGSLTKTGAGTLILTGDNTYTESTTVSAGTLQIGADSTTGSVAGDIVVNASANVTFSRSDVFSYTGDISGDGSLTKAGAGTLILSGENTYTGSTTVNAGILQSDTPNAFAEGAYIVNGGTLAMKDFSLTMTSLFGTGGTVDLGISGSTNLTVNQAGNTIYGGFITGAGALTKAGEGTLTLTGANNYGGNTMVEGGTLQIGNGSTSGSIIGNIVLSDNAGVAFNRSDTFTYSGIISGDGSLTKTGIGVLTLTGINTYTGSTTVNAGTLQSGTSGAFAEGAYIINGGRLELNYSDLTMTSLSGTTDGVVYLGSMNPTTLTVNQTDNTAYNGVITGNGSLTKTGMGTLTLTGNSDYTDGTVVSGGLVNFNRAGNFGSGQITLDGGGLQWATSYNGTDISARLNPLGAGGGIFDTNGNNVTLGSAISGTGFLTKAGMGSLTLTGNNDHSGGVIINAGTLILTGTNTYGGGTTVNAGTLQIGNNGGTGSITGNIATNTTGSSVFFNRSNDITYDGVISGDGSVTKAGVGTLTLTGNNTYSGVTTVNAGTLRIGEGGTHGGITGNLSISNAANVTFNRSDNLAYAGSISGFGSLTKIGAGTLILTGNNTYRGGTTVSAGTLFGNTSSLQGNIVNNAFLEFNQSTDGTYTGNISGNNGTLTKSGTGNVSVAGSIDQKDVFINVGALNINNGYGLTASGQIRVANGAQLGIYAENTPTVVAQTITADSGAILNINGYVSGGPQTVIKTSNGISGDFVLYVDGNPTAAPSLEEFLKTFLEKTDSGLDLVVQQELVWVQESDAHGHFFIDAGKEYILSESLEDNTYSNAGAAYNWDGASLTKTGAGTLILTGDNIYSGSTTIEGGILQIGDNGTTGGIPGDIIIKNNANITFNRFDTVDYDGDISGNGSLTKIGNGTLTLTGFNTYTGNTTVSRGTLAGNIANNTSLTVAAGATYDGTGAARSVTALNGAGDVINTDGLTVQNGAFSGVIYGSGSLTKTGVGTLTLTGDNIYSGGTTVSTGTLQIGNNGTIGSILGNISIGNTANVTFSRSDDVDYGGVISGFGSLTKNGAGTLTMTNDNTYSGVTTVSAGTLQIGNGSTTGSIQGDIVIGTNANVIFNRFNNSTQSGVISGEGSLTKIGAGILTLTGNNTYEGGTTIDAGTLQIGNGSTTGNIIGNIAIGDNANVTFNRSNSITQSGIISGSGSLTKTGAGILTLTGANTYSGGTKIAAGTLTGNTSSLQGDIANDAALEFNQTATGAYSGDISGTGVLTLNGTGAITITGDVSQGSIVINNRALNIDEGYGLTAIGNLSIRGMSQLGIFAGSSTMVNAGTVTVSPGAILNVNGYTGDSKQTVVTTTDGISGEFTLYVGGSVLPGPSLDRYIDITLGKANFDRDLVFQQNLVWNKSIDAHGHFNIADEFTLADSLADNTRTSAGITYGWDGKSLTKTGAGTLILTGDNTYTGDTTIEWGTLQIGGGGTAGSILGDLVLNNTSSVVFNRSNNAAYDGDISGTGTLIMAGTGTLTLTGDNSYNGDTKVNAGTLVGNIAANTNLTIARDATYDGTGAARYVNVLNGEGRVVNDDGLTVNSGTFGGTISGSGSLTKEGTGTLTLTGANAYTGGTTVSAGTLTGNTSGLQGNIVNNAFVEFDQSTDGTYAGEISGIGSLTKTGAGEVVIAGDVNQRDIVISRGALSLAESYGLTASGNLSVLSGAQLGIFAGDAPMVKAGTIAAESGAILNVNNYTGEGRRTVITTTNGINGDFIPYAGGAGIPEPGLDRFLNASLEKTNNNRDLVLWQSLVWNQTTGAHGHFNIVSGNFILLDSLADNKWLGAGTAYNWNGASLTKNGAGTLTLTGTNTYTGDTVVNAGTLAGNIADNTNLTVAAGATYNSMGAARFVNALNGAGNVINTTGLTVQSGAFSGDISGNGSLFKTGRGTLTLSGVNTYLGNTMVNEGVLAGNIPVNTNLTVAAGAVYDGMGEVGIVNVLSGNGDIINSGGLIAQFGYFGGAISGSGFLTKNGMGRLTLTGNNTYKGDTTVNAGTLGGNIAANTNLTIARDATYDGTGAARFVNDLNGAGNVINPDGLTVQSGAFSGVISGRGSLTKIGEGKLTLGGANTYTGITEIKSGTLALSGGKISDTLALYGGTTFDIGAGGAAVNLSRLDVRGTSNWQGDLNMVGQTMNFYLPDTMAADGKMLTVSGRANITDSNVNVDIAGESSPLQSGDTVVLISANTLNGTTVNTLSDGKGMQGVSLKYEFNITTEDNKLLATVVTPVMDERAKALSEGYLGGGLILTNQGANLIDWRGINEAVSAAWKKEVSGSDSDSVSLYGSGSGIFAAFSGGLSKYDTGSRVEISNFSLLAGYAWGENLNSARLTFGPFFEYGAGSYDTFNSFTGDVSVRGNGSAHYFGGGILGRVDITKSGQSNFYIEGSLRAGVAHNEYVNSDLSDRSGRKAAYDSSPVYYGLHFGTGYVWNINKKSSLDLYGKHFWTRQQGDSLALSTGDPVEFNDTDSRRFRFGGLWSYAVEKNVGFYIGAAHEYEFDGKMQATTNGFNIDVPSLRGGTSIWEGGVTLKSTTRPLFLDLGIRGYTGKSDGVTGTLRTGIDTGEEVNEFWGNLYLKFKARFEF